MRRSVHTLQEKRDFAADMRRHPTTAERMLSGKLRRNQFGYRFYQQCLIRGYIVDFYCGRLKLVIEVDGSVHDIEDRAADDEQRERILENYGYLVLRFSNDDVIDHLTVVMSRIWDECSARFTALKGFDFDSGVEPTGEVFIDSSSNRSCGSVEKRLNARTVDKTSVDSTSSIPATAVDFGPDEQLAARLRGIYAKFHGNIPKKNPRPQSEAAALTVNGMHVTEPFRRKA